MDQGGERVSSREHSTGVKGKVTRVGRRGRRGFRPLVVKDEGSKVMGGLTCHGEEFALGRFHRWFSEYSPWTSSRTWTLLKMRLPVPSPDLLHQELWGGAQPSVLRALPGDSDACLSWRNTVLGNAGNFSGRETCVLCVRKKSYLREQGLKSIEEVVRID